MANQEHSKYLCILLNPEKYLILLISNKIMFEVTKRVTLNYLGNIY